MTKPRKNPPTQATPIEEVRQPTGTYLTNWSSWFEIDGSGYVRKDGYRRKGGLDFVRMFVCAGGLKSTESSQYLQLMAVLRAISPERYHANVGIYFALVGLTATLQRCFRGWLLDQNLRPLTDRGMSQRLFVDLKVMQRALRDLLASGLIQRQPLPGFDPSEDDEPQGQADEGEEHGRRQRATSSKPLKNRRPRGTSEDLRKSAKKAERLQEAELANGKEEREIQPGQGAKGQSKTKSSTTPSTAPPEGQGPRSEKPQGVTTGAGRHFPQSGERQPAITPPPRVSDGPRIVPLRPGGDAAPVGSLLPRAVDALAHGYTVQADDFAMEIFSLLRAPFTDENREGVRELANYRAALLEAIDAGLSPGQIEELMGKARADAARIGQHRKRYYTSGGTPERYWRYLLNKHLHARRGQPARAGPASAVATSSAV